MKVMARGRSFIIHGPDEDGVLLVGARKVYFEFHEYTGPAFFSDAGHQREIVKPSRAIWAAFQKWFDGSKYGQRIKHP